MRLFRINFVAILLISFLALYSQTETPSLKKFPFRAAGVLPYTHLKNNSKKNYMLLSREAFGRNKGTWDCFGGSRDAGENHPVKTAAREFAEESIYTLMNPQEAQKYIDVDAGKTTTILANYQKKYVLYITYFDSAMIQKITSNFQENLKTAKRLCLREKNAIGLVSFHELKKAISKNGSRQIIVNGYILDKQKKWIRSEMPLRPILIDMLRPYLFQFPYKQGKHKAIRFY